MAILTRDKIIDAWARLGELAHAEGKSIDIIVVGGAVMAVYFQSRASTADVDGIFAPAPETRRWAQTVADELDLPSDWLNDGAKGYLTGESEGPVLHQSAGIVVRYGGLCAPPGAQVDGMARRRRFQRCTENSASSRGAARNRLLKP